MLAAILYVYIIPVGRFTGALNEYENFFALLDPAHKTAQELRWDRKACIFEHVDEILFAQKGVTILLPPPEGFQLFPLLTFPNFEAIIIQKEYLLYKTQFELGRQLVDNIELMDLRRGSVGDWLAFHEKVVRLTPASPENRIIRDAIDAHCERERDYRPSREVQALFNPLRQLSEYELAEMKLRSAILAIAHDAKVIGIYQRLKFDELRAMSVVYGAVASFMAVAVIFGAMVTRRLSLMAVRAEESIAKIGILVGNLLLMLILAGVTSAVVALLARLATIGLIFVAMYGPGDSREANYRADAMYLIQTASAQKVEFCGSVSGSRVASSACSWFDLVVDELRAGLMGRRKFIDESAMPGQPDMVERANARFLTFLLISSLNAALRSNEGARTGGEYMLQPWGGFGVPIPLVPTQSWVT
jgi:hypothetical protein